MAYATSIVYFTVRTFLTFTMLNQENRQGATSGTYNDECYLPQDKLNNLRYAIKTICETMDAHNMTYWLDYGTLLGAVRRGDVLPWDGDADISFLRDQEKYVVHEELIKIHSIQSNELQANYKGLSIDYVRWEEIEGSYSGQKQTLLHKYYPSFVLKNENMLVLWNHELDTFPKAWWPPKYHSATHVPGPTSKYHSATHATGPTSKYHSATHATGPTSKYHSATHATGPTSKYHSATHVPGPTSKYHSATHANGPTSK
ncbi:predicted protein [Nematostella vectensis]|uniref:LicD/FKTN/FKRP nucleotidyltransferase domain-containing protein n=1 Tax=Nematostella vectensis TaxID=45351 RepID=A7T1X1_NEMVE|nr:predicted protein [Nematostella vectensis]|eukprot:XP_001622146.1 predicted protein [Nematostella vectensis]